MMTEGLKLQITYFERQILNFESFSLKMLPR